jgi:hypothetical protein
VRADDILLDESSTQHLAFDQTAVAEKLKDLKLKDLKLKDLKLKD